jgi:hypothetical protein
VSSGRGESQSRKLDRGGCCSSKTVVDGGVEYGGGPPHGLHGPQAFMAGARVARAVVVISPVESGCEGVSRERGVMDGRRRVEEGGPGDSQSRKVNRKGCCFSKEMEKEREEQEGARVGRAVVVLSPGESGRMTVEERVEGEGGPLCGLPSRQASEERPWAVGAAIVISPVEEGGERGTARRAAARAFRMSRKPEGLATNEKPAAVRSKSGATAGSSGVVSCVNSRKRESEKEVDGAGRGVEEEKRGEMWCVGGEMGVGLSP